MGSYKQILSTPCSHNRRISRMSRRPRWHRVASRSVMMGYADELGCVNRQRSGCQKHEIKNVFRDTYHSPAAAAAWYAQTHGWVEEYTRPLNSPSSRQWRKGLVQNVRVFPSGRRNNISRHIFREMSPLWIISRHPLYRKIRQLATRFWNRNRKYPALCAVEKSCKERIMALH